MGDLLFDITNMILVYKCEQGKREKEIYPNF